MAFAPSGSRRRGFTAVEILIVMVLIGLMSAVALPFLRNAAAKSGVSGALAAVTGLHAVARNSAIQRGRTAVLVVSGATETVLVVLRRSGSTAVDTVGRAENLYTRFGVDLQSTSDSVVFTPRGIGTASGSTSIVATRGDYADTLVISAAGRLVR